MPPRHCPIPEAEMLARLDIDAALLNLPRSEHAVRRAVRAYVQGVPADEAVLNEAITLEGDTVTVEALTAEEVSV